MECKSIPVLSCVVVSNAEGPHPLFLLSVSYWLYGADASNPFPPYRAYCDMETNGGGWEVVHKNSGGPARPVTDNVANQELRDNAGIRRSPLLPPSPAIPQSQTSGMSTRSGT